MSRCAASLIQTIKNDCDIIHGDLFGETFEELLIFVPVASGGFAQKTSFAQKVGGLHKKNLFALDLVLAYRVYDPIR